MGIAVRTPTAYEWDVVQKIEVGHKNKTWPSRNKHISFKESDYDEDTCIDVSGNMIMYGKGTNGIYSGSGYKFLDFNVYLNKVIEEGVITKVEALQFILDYQSSKGGMIYVA